MSLNYLLPGGNITICSKAKILFSDLCMRLLWNRLYKAHAECVNQGINPIYAKFYLFPKIIKGFPFPEMSNIVFLTFSP